MDLPLPKQNNTTVIISNDKIRDLTEIVKFLKDSGLLLIGVSKTIQKEAKEQKGRFLSMLLGTLGAGLLGNILAGKGTIAKSVSEETKSKSQGRGVNKAGEGAKSVSKEIKSKRQGQGIVTADYGNKKVRKKTIKNNKKF